jgi:hypothetical protein
MRALRLLMLWIVPLCVFAQSPSQNSAESDLEGLKSLLKEGAVTEVQVLHMHDSTLTRVAVSREALRSMASSDLKFSDHIAEKFSPLFSGVSTKRENHTPDLRWGVLFYDAQHHEIGSVFVDQFGQHGYLKGQTVSFDTAPVRTDIARRLHKITGISD